MYGEVLGEKGGFVEAAMSSRFFASATHIDASELRVRCYDMAE